MAGKLRIAPGAGAGYEIEADVAREYHGSVQSVLRDLARDHIRDPDLRQMLNDPRLAVDEFLEGGREQPLALSTDWDRVVQRLDEGAVELGIARVHSGGSGGPGGGVGPGGNLSLASGSAASRTARSTSTVRPHCLIEHPSGFEPGPSDRRAARAGTAVWVGGRALALAERFCRLDPRMEVMWYWATRDADWPVITEIVVPWQAGSPGSVAAGGPSVLRAARESRRQGLRIIGAGHSHGDSPVFSSQTDLHNMLELARERVGVAARCVQKLTGHVTGPLGVGGSDRVGLEVTFPQQPNLRVVLQLPPGSGPRDVTAEALVAHPRLVSCFSTSNSRGDHYFPLFVTTRCGVCGRRDDQARFNEEVEVHVVGPHTSLVPRDEAWIRNEFRTKVHPTGARTEPASDDSAADQDFAVTAASSGEAPAPPPTTTVVGAGTASELGAADYVVYRRGAVVGRVPAPLMEEAGAKVPGVAAALGWLSEAGSTPSMADRTGTTHGTQADEPR